MGQWKVESGNKRINSVNISLKDFMFTLLAWCCVFLGKNILCNIKNIFYVIHQKTTMPNIFYPYSMQLKKFRYSKSVFIATYINYFIFYIYHTQYSRYEVTCDISARTEWKIMNGTFREIAPAFCESICKFFVKKIFICEMEHHKSHHR